MWNLLFQFVISAAISYLLTPRPKVKNAVAGQAETPTAEAGTSIPVLFGTMEITSANVVFSGDPLVEPITVDTGGKGK